MLACRAVLTSADAWIDALGLAPNPEGGFYRLHHAGPPLAGAARPLVTIIYYLVRADAPRARLHRSQADAIHYHHVGGELRLHTLDDAGAHEVHALGADAPQRVIAGGLWKAIELVSGPFALISEAVVPGWVPRDHERAGAALLAGLAPSIAAALAPFVGGAP